MDDQTFLEAFESCTIPDGEFHHADHVRLAWILLQSQPLEEVLPRYSRGIRRFAESKGVSNLYHQTITWTYLFVINERMAAARGATSWEEFRGAHPDLFENHRRFLGRYYSAEALESDLARREYLLPDRGCRLAA